MSHQSTDTVADRFLAVLRGNEDPRLRAVWRVLLALPLILVTGAVSQTIAGMVGLSGLARVGLLQATTFGLALAAWARYVDRRPVRDYGLSATPQWAGDVAVAFVAVLVAQSVWHGVGDALGWTSVQVAATADGSFALAFAAAFVGVAATVWIQETAYFGLVLRNAAEGLHARDLPARHAVLGGWVLGALYVVAIHSGSLQRPGLFVAGAVYGLLYVHTGELALPVGFHLGVNFTGGWVFTPAGVERAAVFAVSESHSLFSTLSGPGIPQMVVGYLLVVGWLRLRDRPVDIATSIAEWTPR
jgi:membrane protease YdiL (CAAX protease family)